jgi:Holliday junction resolvase
VKFRNSNGSPLAEVDVWLENGDSVMAVEIKSKLLQKHVNDHIERMEKLQGYAKEHGDKRKLLGALAGAIVKKDARDYAIQKGFYVIEQSGDTVKIEMPEKFKPKAW